MRFIQSPVRTISGTASFPVLKAIVFGGRRSRHHKGATPRQRRCNHDQKRMDPQATREAGQNRQERRNHCRITHHFRNPHHEQHDDANHQPRRHIMDNLQLVRQPLRHARFRQCSRQTEASAEKIKMPHGSFSASFHVNAVRSNLRSNGTKKSKSAPTSAMTASSIPTPMSPVQKSLNIQPWTQNAKLRSSQFHLG